MRRGVKGRFYMEENYFWVFFSFLCEREPDSEIG